MLAKNRGANPVAVNSIPGQVEKRLERSAAVWRRRCEGASMMSLAREFGLSSSTVHGYIEDVRKQLREATVDLAAQEREQSLALIDAAIEQVMPHIRHGELLKIRTMKQGNRGPVVISVEEYQARMKGCEVLVKLIDRKAKLLGMDAPAKTEEVAPPRPPPTAEELKDARETLARWVNFAPRDIQGGGVGGHGCR